MESNIKAPTRNESRVIKFMILLGIFSILNFLFYFFQPEHAGDPLIFTLLTITILYSILKKLYMWYNYSNISVPIPPEQKTQFTVDVLTTYFPGEPYQMTVTTLEAIKNITYPHTTYLCDEANDPYLKKFCEENEIIHVTRDNRIDAKAGNINNALQKFAKGDICVVLDPDHIPEPNFLDPILPFFENPEIGFVQIVQSYYNIKETLVSRGAAEQTFQFYGPMMMTLNSYGAVNAIGANCVFRRSALDSIGGHAAGLCEDMHTAMLLYSKGWKAVYLPVVLARGLAPSNLTNFFKQQLKWSRGTFDLLFKVYPKIFSKLTGRQKIHYGILPLHYLGGVIILINFLIPILSLLFSTTPWEGNIVDFLLVLLPVAASSLLIRTYIQKWVIEKKERGFHLVGGLLHINTWWIYIIGLFFTLIDKKVPYLPTPKEDEWNTNIKIIIPNISVALLSIIAIMYGLSQDLTPFSIIMAFFAFFNACIMFFGVYLTNRVTNQNKILRHSLGKREVTFLWNLKRKLINFANALFVATRKIALPLLLALIITSMSFKQQKDLSKWEQVEQPTFQKINNNYLGIFHPSSETGISDIAEIDLIENRQNVDFDIISFYLAWNEESLSNFPFEQINDAYLRNSIPMITWEPWITGMASVDTLDEASSQRGIFKQISNGSYDNYIREFSSILGSFKKPIFLRYAHEFDNHQYPWGIATNNSPEEFIAAWKHIYSILKEEGANNVILVWNPWKADKMAAYYPGDDYVDWIGYTMLNYGPLNDDQQSYSFENLYTPFKEAYLKITRKPVMLAEFGSLNLRNRQNEWLMNATDSIKSNHAEISAVVLFNSSFDKNIPANDLYNVQYLDWKVGSFSEISSKFAPGPGVPDISLDRSINRSNIKNSLTFHEIRGINYKKGTNWRNNYYTLTKNVIREDFRLLKEAGINTIQFAGGNIYDKNILKYSKEFNLKVIYEFNINSSVDFINDKDGLRKIRQEIIEDINRHEDQENIIGYSIRYDLENFYEKPLLHYQRIGFLNWLNSLTHEIKALNNQISLNINLSLDAETIQNITLINSYLPVDSFGLIIKKDTTFLSKVKSFSSAEKIPVFISDLKSEFFIEGNEHLIKQDIILENWQDERKSNSFTLNGIVDFKGRKKQEYTKVAEIWAGKELKVNKQLPKTGIIKPAIPLIPGNQYTYHASILSNGEWRHPKNKEESLKFEWNLIKKDEYGNFLAMKELGKGPTIQVQIPENYKNYELLLVSYYEAEGPVINSRATLHTPGNN